jgi:serine/threonine-protein kinase
VGTLPAAAPATVQRLLLRCLDKDQRRRLHDIADARIEIEDMLTGAALASADPTGILPEQRHGRFALSIGGIAAFVVLFAAGGAWYVRAPPASRRISRMTITSSGAAAPAISGLRSMAITPDGTRVIYVGNNGTQLFVRSLDRIEPTAISTSAARLNWLFVSPDGQRVGFVEGNTLKRCLSPADLS